jgi:antitoxin ParD1/3/4
MQRQNSSAEERDARLNALRAMLKRSMAEGGEVTEEELDAALEAKAAQLAKEGP